MGQQHSTSCIQCKQIFRPRRSDARYCGDKCRKAASRGQPTEAARKRLQPFLSVTGYPDIQERLFASDSGSVTDKHQCFQWFAEAEKPPLGRIEGPSEVIEAEVFGRYRWRSSISSDGVEIEVARLRPRALVL
jgi:hypothetical protein